MGCGVFSCLLLKTSELRLSVLRKISIVGRISIIKRICKSMNVRNKHENYQISLELMNPLSIMGISMLIME